MSLKKIEQVKKDRGFKILDLIIYGAVLALVAALFIAVFTTRDTSALTGVKITVGTESVFEYEFGGEPQKKADCVTVEEDGKSITVTVVTDGGTNVVYIDKAEKTAKMIEADCRGKQCMYFPELDNNSKYIYCSPHGVKVEPLFRDWNSPDIII
ncbi:MAG: NusG domain II-containing protein [Clostridia bacterium]|nr:NusG domain II-containing protein [Clostridia bacterium]